MDRCHTVQENRQKLRLPSMGRKGAVLPFLLLALVLTLPGVTTAQNSYAPHTYPPQKDPVRVYQTQEEGGVYQIYGDNDYPIPVWISIDFPTLYNLKSSVSLPFRTLLSPRSVKVPLFQLEALPHSGRKSFRMTVSYARGDPTSVRPDPHFLYIFPFPHGKKYRLSQGPNGAFTHYGENQFA